VEGEQILKKLPPRTGGLDEDNYGCIYFQGQENGRNFHLLVPDTHPDLVSFKYKEKAQRGDGKEIELNR